MNAAGWVKTVVPRTLDHADAYEEFLPNRSIGTPGQRPDENDLAGVIGHKRDVRRFECRLRATRSHAISTSENCQ